MKGENLDSSSKNEKLKETENPSYDKRDKLDMLQASFQAVLGQEGLFAKIIELFPYPVQVYDKEGTSVMVNRTLLEEFEIPDKDMVIGRYNIFKDPEIEKAKLMPFIKEVFKGKVHTVTDIKVPLKSIKECYQIENYGIDAMYQDATGFPIMDEHGEVSNIVILLITRKIYKGKVSIVNAVEYLENNWYNEYNLN